MKLYGIPNCNTVKKVQKTLSEQGHDYQFINFKKAPPNREFLLKVRDFIGDDPVNKRGTTYRKLKNKYEEASLEKRIALLVENPSAIKRPILERKGEILGIGIDILEKSLET